MLKKIRDHKLRSLGVLLLIVLLAAIRLFENKLFYDPFLDFFKNEFAGKQLPGFRLWELAASMFFRYFLNTIISIAMIYTLFKDKTMIRFCLLLYLSFFIVLMAAFFLILYGSDNPNLFTLFYVRRFIIQPLFVILFIPAFYYQNSLIKK